MTNGGSMQVRVDDARWDGAALVLEGHALVDDVPPARRWTNLLRVDARDRATTRSFGLPVTRVRDEDGAWGGFVTNVDVATLAAASGGRSSRYAFRVRLTTASARRSHELDAARPGRASTPGAHLLPDGTLAVAGWGEDGLELAVHPDPTYLRSVEVEGPELVLGLRLGARDRRAADAGRLDVVLAREGAPDVRVEVPSSGRTVLAPAALERRESGLPAADWSVRLVTRAERDGDPDGLPAPVTAGPDAGELALPHGDGELAVVVDVLGHVLLRDAPVTPRADAVTVEDGHLVLSGGAAGPVDGPVTLVQEDDVAASYPLEQDPVTHGWTARVPLDGEPGSTALRRLAAGSYLVRSSGPLRLAGDLPGRGVVTTVEGVGVEVCWDSERRLTVEIARPDGDGVPQS